VPIASWPRAARAATQSTRGRPGAQWHHRDRRRGPRATLQDAAAALIRGDVRSYLDLFVHADDYTLVPPFGGEPRHGFDDSEHAVEQLSRFFTGGEAQVDVVQSYIAGECVVLVLIERQHGTVGGLPDQDWSLRVTMMFRREGDDWRLVHRHADPLVREINLRRAAELARGERPPADG
jgi:ketosteroid isomerase-like protein